MVFSRLFKRKPKVQEIDRKKAEARHGFNLRKLKETPEWADLLLVKDKLQEDAGVQAVNALSDDKARFFAACQYTTLQNFFMEISRRIQVGEQSQKELEQWVKEK